MGNIRVVVRPENIGEVPDVASNVDWYTYLINIGLSIALLGMLYLMAAWFITWQKARFNRNKKESEEYQNLSRDVNQWIDEKIERDKNRESENAARHSQSGRNDQDG